MVISYRRKWWSAPASILGAVAALAVTSFATTCLFVIIFALAESFEQEPISEDGLVYVSSSGFDPPVWVVGMCYFLSGVVGVLAALRTFRFLRMELVYPVDGLYCSQCDYNLTGNESGVCPECGKTILFDDSLGSGTLM